jgi:hypothetical protein
MYNKIIKSKRIKAKEINSLGFGTAMQLSAVSKKIKN